MRCSVSDVDEPASRALPEHIRRSWICFRISRLFVVFIPNTVFSRYRLIVQQFIPLCFCFPFIRTENVTNFFTDRTRREWWDGPRSVRGDHTRRVFPRWRWWWRWWEGDVQHTFYITWLRRYSPAEKRSNGVPGRGPSWKKRAMRGS